MKQKFDEEFPESEEDLDFIPEEFGQNFLGSTVELSNEGFSQKMVQTMNKNEVKIAKLKLKILRKEKKQIKQYLKKNLLV
ncbi:hypothetical protein LCGC14_1371570 [marine sediment metagenome]|uniref:Uncharacterized protein n=1 Tax=marine sediment metagenome TaxID=412755 RepID=A0A0F9MKI3_9ZZZZ